MTQHMKYRMYLVGKVVGSRRENYFTLTGRYEADQSGPLQWSNGRRGLGKVAKEPRHKGVVIDSSGYEPIFESFGSG